MREIWPEKAEEISPVSAFQRNGSIQILIKLKLDIYSDQVPVLYIL